MSSSETKKQIIRAGMGIIARQGFNTAGIDAILKQANVPKGSFYYYFTSKKDFGLQVLDHFAEGIDRIFTSYLTDNRYSPLARLRNCVESLVDRFENNNCSIGCLAANLGQEMADQCEDFRQRLAGVFQSWTDRFAQCLEEARTKGEIPSESSPRALAEFFLAGFEGALLIAKVMKSPDPLRNFVTGFFTSMTGNQSKGQGDNQ